MLPHVSHAYRFRTAASAPGKWAPVCKLDRDDCGVVQGTCRLAVAFQQVRGRPGDSSTLTSMQCHNGLKESK